MKLIILDRDGVINYDSDKYIKSPEEWKPIPGSLEAIARLHRADCHVVVATNQSGVARGLFTLDTLARIPLLSHCRTWRSSPNWNGIWDAWRWPPRSRRTCSTSTWTGHSTS